MECESVEKEQKLKVVEVSDFLATIYQMIPIWFSMQQVINDIHMKIQPA